MAKVKDLKREIEYISGELLMEAAYCSMQPGMDLEKINHLVSRICETSDEFIMRVQHPSGKDDKLLVKQYYKKLREDFNTEVDKIFTELVSLNGEKGQA